MSTQLKRLLMIGAGFALAFCLAACDFGKSASRIEYWQNETARQLPVGTSKADAEKFFRDRGLRLGCCISGKADMVNSHLAKEKNIGRELFTQYDAAIVVDFEQDKVARVSVLRFGIGL